MDFGRWNHGRSYWQNPTVEAKIEEQTDLLTLLGWADEIAARKDIRLPPDGRKAPGMQVWANADIPRMLNVPVIWR